MVLFPSTGQLESFCVEWACSPCVCVRVLGVPPTVQILVLNWLWGKRSSLAPALLWIWTGKEDGLMMMMIIIITDFYNLLYQRILFSKMHYLIWHDHVCGQGWWWSVSFQELLDQWVPETKSCCELLFIPTIPVSCALCLSDPGPRTVCHPPYSSLPVEKSSVSAQHSLPPTLPVDCWGAQSSDS